MNPRHAFSIFLAVLIVPVALVFSGASLKAALLSVLMFWSCLVVFFYPSISDYFKNRKHRRQS
ncbi:MAG: hypothetical protein EP339_13530 [Gammaproteobacteria bacterium]|uniref:Uncharacterized protein n=1 Tax=Marinobacter nitratireducens TaxID=1137280 RepID=A0A072N0Z1_9GAMM|nr:hypothetical protein [Marinobacter nitratireducens]KEF31156.1 hypothetical protein D777_02309 [Marinobacter nitratireducens]TNE72443.1 MAG: hypothetical protein EP339_13530 [Gammaproteobacteria bacterium]